MRSHLDQHKVLLRRDTQLMNITSCVTANSPTFASLLVMKSATNKFAEKGLRA